MSETKWTKGPWRVVNDSSVVARIDMPGEERESLVVRLDGSSTCHTKSQNNANAHLIAAAPEMYEQLDNLLTAIATTPGSKHVKHLMEAVSDAGMVMRKARGEQ